MALSQGDLLKTRKSSYNQRLSWVNYRKILGKLQENEVQEFEVQEFEEVRWGYQETR